MVAHALLGAGAEPGYLIGGALRTTGENADWGAGEWLVVEADESDRSMLALDVDVAVVLNIELDHHATYGSLAELNEVFDAFRAAGPATGRRAGAGARRATPSSRPRISSSRRAARASPGAATTVVLQVPGAHNARNAAAALEAIRVAGRGGPGRGGRRAGELRGRRPALRAPRGRRRAARSIVDDYAHHPTEVAATIAAARSLAPRRLVAIFQPHLFSRTQELAPRVRRGARARRRRGRARRLPGARAGRGLPGRVGQADRRGRRRRGRRAHGVLAADASRRPGRVLAPRLRDGDLVLVMGAGDVDALGRALVARLPWQRSANDQRRGTTEPSSRRLSRPSTPLSWPNGPGSNPAREGTAGTRRTPHADAPRRRPAAGPRRSAPAAGRRLGPCPDRPADRGRSCGCATLAGRGQARDGHRPLRARGRARHRAARGRGPRHDHAARRGPTSCARSSSRIRSSRTSGSPPTSRTA